MTIMPTHYGIADHEGTAHTTPFTVWSGAFMGNREASGTARHGARSVTITTEWGDRVRVTLPEGVTFPRTDENYRQIDDAINDALNAHYTKGCNRVDSPNIQ